MPPFLDVGVREYLSTLPGNGSHEVLYSKEVFNHVRAAQLTKESPIPEGEHTPEKNRSSVFVRLLYLQIQPASPAKR